MTWTGLGTDANWKTVGNWQGPNGPAEVPGSGDALFFPGTNDLVSNNNYPSDTYFSFLQFNPNAGSFTLTGNAILNPQTQNYSTSVQTIDTNLDFTSGGGVSGTGFNVITSANGGDVVVNGNVSLSNDRLVESGPGVMTLSGTNTIGSSGGTLQVAGGTLRVTSSQSLDNAAIALSGTLDFRSDSPVLAPNSTVSGAGGTINVDQAIGGSGTNLTDSIGTLSTLGNNGSTFTITGGHGYGLTIGTLIVPGNYIANDLGPGGELTVGTLNLTNALSGTLELLGSGATSLTGPVINQYLTTIKLGGMGTLSLSASNLISSGTLSDAGGTIVETADNAITGTASIYVNGSSPAIVTLSHPNNYTGGTSVESGTLNLTCAGAISGGRVATTGVISETVPSAIAGTASLNVYGGTVTLPYSNSYFGGTSIAGGTLIVSAADALGTGSVQLATGTLDLQSPAAVDSSALYVSGGNLLQTVPNTLTGSASLSVDGGSITLSQPSSYTGGTTLSGGTLIFNAAGALGSGTLTLTGGNFIDNVANYFTGASSLAINGSALTVTLNEPNNFTQGTTLDSGTLILNDLGALGSGPLNLVGGNFVENVNNYFTGSSSLNVNSSTLTVTLNASNNFTGGTTLNGGTLIVNTAGALGQGTVSLVAGSFVNNVVNSISGTSSLSINAPQLSVTLGQSNDYTGGTFLGAGTLICNSAGALGSGSINVSGGSFSLRASGIVNNQRLNVSGGGCVVNASNAITGSSALIVSGGSVALTAPNNFTGGTIVSGGSLTVAAGPGPGVGTGSVQLSAGTLIAEGAGALGSGAIYITGGNFQEQDGNNEISSTNSLNINGATVAVQLTEPNTYTGGTTLSAGTLSLQAAGAIGAGSVNIAGGKLSESTADALKGSVSLNIAGGTAVLSASNAYTGGTTISAGTLLISNATAGSSTGSGSVVLTGGELTGTGQISGSVSVAQGATLAPGSNGDGSLAAGTVSLSDGAIFSIQLNSNNKTAEELSTTGSVSLGTSTFALLNVTDVGNSGLAMGVSFTIINAAAGVNGTFSGLAQGSTFPVGPNQYAISYATPDEVLLTTVPEPFFFAGCAFAGLLMRRQRAYKPR